MAVKPAQLSKESIIMRPAKISDATAMATIAKFAYRGTPLFSLLSPRAKQYPEDNLRAWRQRIVLRMLSPRNVSTVICLASDPDTAIAYSQFARLGDDTGAETQIAMRWSVWLVLLSWFYDYWYRLVNFVRPDRSADFAAVAKFMTMAEKDTAVHWDPFPERQCRWHAQSVVVAEEWQGRGLGHKIMQPGMQRAMKDGVPIGLEASEDGERLYRKLGFELLGRFIQPIDSELGGVMMWTPEGWDAKVKGRASGGSVEMDVAPIKVD